VVTAIDGKQITIQGDEGKSRSFALLKDWSLTVRRSGFGSSGNSGTRWPST
jgi:hypothetical protein